MRSAADILSPHYLVKCKAHVLSADHLLRRVLPHGRHIVPDVPSGYIPVLAAILNGLHETSTASGFGFMNHDHLIWKNENIGLGKATCILEMARNLVMACCCIDNTYIEDVA